MGHSSMTFILAGAILLGAAGAWAEFALEDDGKALTVSEDGKAVLVYRYTWVEPPEGVDARYRRMSYIHPLYGLDGDVLTQDFPDDHYHHRGVFWAWPNCSVGERRADVWLIDGIRQVFEKWIERNAGEDQASVGVQNVWLYDDDKEPKVREEVRFTVLPADEDGRAIDFHLKWTNICKEPVTFLGATTAKKGYGGFCIRPDKARKPMVFHAQDGRVTQDKLEYDTPWADCMSTVPDGGPTSGVAIFQHPANPGYPHKGWDLPALQFPGSIVAPQRALYDSARGMRGPALPALRASRRREEGQGGQAVQAVREGSGEGRDGMNYAAWGPRYAWDASWS